MILSGPTPNFTSTDSVSSSSLVMVLMRVTLSLTNWARSLSPVETSVGMPISVACCDRVPMTSSASTSLTINNGRPMASMI